MASVLDNPFSPKTSLAGRTVLITRPRDQAIETCSRFETLGVRVLTQPAIEILPTESVETLDEALRSVAENQVDWVVFSSANGVRAVFDRLCVLYSLETLKCGEFWKRNGASICVVGEGTGKALAPYGLKPDVVPERFVAEGLVAALDEVVKDYPSQRFLSFRASRGRQVLAEAMKARGARWREVEAYRRVDVTKPDPAVLEALRAGEIDVSVVTSSASAKALVQMFGDDVHKTRWVAISPLTADAMKKLGVSVAKVATEATMESLVESVFEELGGRRS
jgi:uroporphyrinogen III methyltransferase/synthase